MPGTASRTLRVPVKQLRRECNPRVFAFKTTAELPLLEGTVGQDRAVSAIDFGLSIEADGFNLFVAGPPGTGRTTELKTQLARVSGERPPPRDWCYVFNFAEPTRPRALSLPAGRGHQLMHDIEDLIAAVRREVPRAFESDEYAQRRDQVNREMQLRREQFFEALEREARSRELAVNATPMGITTIPMVEGKPLTKEQYDELSEERRHQIQERTAELDSIIAQMMPQLRRLDRGVAQLFAELDKQVVAAITKPLIEDLKRDYEGETRVLEFIDALSADLVEHIDAFRSADAEPQSALGALTMPPRDDTLNRYKVNVIVTHDSDARAPVIFEESPSYYHIFGRMDFRASFGAMVTDHTMIKPGALHRANGGYVVLDALDTLRQPLVWDTLKRTLRTRQVRLENMGEQLSIIPTATLIPEPIPLDVKVVLVGTGRLYQVLQSADEDFHKLFKAKADFTIDVERVDEHVELYARFIATQAAMKGMRPFDRTAVARIVEHASRMVADQDKLSLQMMDVVDLLVEADYWACDADSKHVTEQYVEKAIEKRVYRSNLIEERVQKLIRDGVLKVNLDGTGAGEVNGLSVHDVGDYTFGRPSRITARVSLGRGQVINIEREIQKSGPAHSKGFLILIGYINGKFAHRQPLSFSASIAFEQLYDEVDGDSASSTELYALLSAITDLPLRQDLAVTGSVNQLGEIQAIGGVNEKIEGFYAVCKARGLTGTQGVVIPRDNIKNLMLKPEVVEAVAAGKFHVYAISTVEQGIELLTGVAAGKLRKDGTYAAGTVFRKVTDTLEAMTRRAIEVNRAAQRDGMAPLPPAPVAMNGETPPKPSKPVKPARRSRPARKRR